MADATGVTVFWAGSVAGIEANAIPKIKIRRMYKSFTSLTMHENSGERNTWSSQFCPPNVKLLSRTSAVRLVVRKATTADLYLFSRPIEDQWGYLFEKQSEWQPQTADQTHRRERIESSNHHHRRCVETTVRRRQEERSR